MDAQTRAERRTDLDWLRVLAILMIFVFHTGRFFDTLDWHIKNTRQYLGATAWSTFVASWIMPLIFVVSAASTWYALRSRGGRVFLKERALRLLIPLVVGVFTHAAMQVYLERLSHRQFQGSFWAFYPRYFDGLYGAGQGNFAFHGLHLWYLLVLFVFSALFVPLLLWLRGPRGQRVYTSIGDALALPGVAYLLAIPIIAAMLLSRDDSLLLTRAFGGWNLLDHAQFFLYGIVVATHADTRRTVEQSRWVSLGIGLLATGFLLALEGRVLVLPGAQRSLLTGVLFALSGWLWVLALLGFGGLYLRHTSALLTYANEAVLPFYVLHQSVLVAVGYVVVRWPLPDPLKFVVIGASSFVLILVLYEYLIRRVNILRVLFGMRVVAHRTMPNPAPRAA